MAAYSYHRVYDTRHLQADRQEPGSPRNHTLGNRVWATFTLTDMALRIMVDKLNADCPYQLAGCFVPYLGSCWMHTVDCVMNDCLSITRM